MSETSTSASSNNGQHSLTGLEIARLGAQSFAIFIGLSILLGRVYSILYTEKLGIPVSSINIGPIDYAILSPDVALMSVSIAISISLLLVLATRINHEQRVAMTTAEALPVIGFVILLVGLGYGMVLIPAQILTGPDLLPVGIRGAVTASGVILASLGFVVATQKFAGLAGTRAAAVQYLGYAAVLGVLVYFLSWSIVAFASDDAFKDVTESPTALLEVVPTELPTELNCDATARDGASKPVNVVHTNDRFIFVVDSSIAVKARERFKSLNEARRDVKGNLPIYAIPNESIRRIKYINNEDYGGCNGEK